MYEAYLFGLNDTLYNATEQKSRARFAAVESMIENGLPVDIETAYTMLEEVVREVGEDAPNHFNILLRKLGVKEDPRIIAAGVVAYRDVSRAALRPFPGVPTTLIALRERGRKLTVISSGDPVKEWQKLIQLGLQHFFHHVWVAERTPLTPTTIEKALQDMDLTTSKTVFVSGVPAELAAAKKVGLQVLLFQPKKMGGPRTNSSQEPVLRRFQDILAIDQD